MIITFGTAPALLRPAGGVISKYRELWLALASRPEGEWVRVDAQDVGGADAKHKTGGLMSSGQKYFKRKVQAIMEGEFVYIRFRLAPEKPPVPPKPSASTPKPPLTPAKSPAITSNSAPVKPVSSSQQPLPAIAAPKVAPTPLPIAPAPGARPRTTRDIDAVRADIDAMLTRLLATRDTDEWDSLQVGSDISYHRQFTEELRLTAKARCLGFTIETDIDGSTLYCRLIPVEQ